MDYRTPSDVTDLILNGPFTPTFSQPETIANPNRNQGKMGTTHS